MIRIGIHSNHIVCSSTGREQVCNRRQNYASENSVSKKGLYADLYNNVFDYGQMAAANQMRTSWENLAQHVGTNYGQVISN